MHAVSLTYFCYFTHTDSRFFIQRNLYLFDLMKNPTTALHLFRENFFRVICLTVICDLTLLSYSAKVSFSFYRFPVFFHVTFYHKLSYMK